jgi:hypothetical protein
MIAASKKEGRQTHIVIVRLAPKVTRA